MNPMPGPPYEWDEHKRRRNIETHRIGSGWGTA